MSSGNRFRFGRVHRSVKRGSLCFLAVMAAMAVACQRAPDIEGATLTGVALAGPTCPVVREPRDPACDDRPVAGAEIVIVDARGDEVASAVTDAAGTFSVALPAGEYQLVPQPVEGLLWTPGATAIVVRDGVDLEPLTILYDTGIR